MTLAFMSILWVVVASKSTPRVFRFIPWFQACTVQDTALCSSLALTTLGIQISIFLLRACSDLVFCGRIVTTSSLVLTYMLALFTYALFTHLYRGNGHVWLQTVEDARDFRLPALTHKPKESDGRFMDGSDGRGPQANVPSATPLIPNVQTFQ